MSSFIMADCWYGSFVFFYHAALYLLSQSQALCYMVYLGFLKTFRCKYRPEQGVWVLG